MRAAGERRGVGGGTCSIICLGSASCPPACLRLSCASSHLQRGGDALALTPWAPLALPMLPLLLPAASVAVGVAVNEYFSQVNFHSYYDSASPSKLESSCRCAAPLADYISLATTRGAAPRLVPTLHRLNFQLHLQMRAKRGVVRKNCASAALTPPICIDPKNKNKKSNESKRENTRNHAKSIWKLMCKSKIVAHLQML